MSSATTKGNDWRPLLSLSINQQTENPISCTKFDPYEELIWCASSTGKVTSFSPATNYNRYSAFVSTRFGSVNCLDVTEEVIFSLSDDCLRGTSRQGIPLSKYTSLSMTKMSSICRIPNTSMYIMGGEQSKLLQFDFNKEKEIRTFDMAENNAVLIRYNGSNTFTADSIGYINVRNSKTLETIQRLPCHGDHISDFDVQGSKLITCGFSQRLKTSHGDPFVKIFDLRMYKAMAPIALSFAPRFVRFMPSYCEKLVVVSQNGGVRISELNSNVVGTSIIVDTDGVSSFDFSTSKQFMCFGSYSGALSVYADRDEPVMNEESYDTVLAFPPVGPPVSFSIEDTQTPFSTVPMPFPEDDSLLSDWPPELTQPMYRLMRPPTEHTDKRVMHYVTQVKNPRFNTKLRLHNVCPYILENEAIPSEKSRESPQSLATEKVRVAKFYKKCPQMIVPVRRRAGQAEEETETYNYNQTNHVPIASTYHMNILTNPIVHALYHVMSVRNLFFSHICVSDSCLPCQLHFLFSMISDPTCSLPSSSNLIRTLVSNGFITFKHDVIKSTKLAIQLFFGGIREVFENSTNLENMCLRTEMISNCRCVRCGALQQPTPKNEYIVTVPYSGDLKSPSFCQIIEKSLHLGEFGGLTHDEIECDECRATTKMESKRKILKLADVLVIDTNSTNEIYHEFWQRQLANFERKPIIRHEKSEEEEEKEKKSCRFGHECRNKNTCKFQHGKIDWEKECSKLIEDGEMDGWKHYIPSKIATIITDGIVRMNDISECEHYDEPNHEIYELVSIVAMIGNGEYPVKWSHSVTIIKDNQDKCTPWTLINEQLVCRLHQNEALHFDSRWKLPILLQYRKQSKTTTPEVEIRKDIPESLFFCDDNLASNAMTSSGSNELIELPKKGELVGIDAEFIKIKCSKLDNERRGVLSRAVGRVSCVDSTGKNIIFDDHVQVIDSNDVSDYLTPYSGIRSDDLDASKSTKYLTTLKRVYLKILILVQRGCIFVGHALNNDFSVLNVHVPGSQVIDTVNLLRLDSKRLLSLQFLALQLIGDKIQEDCHDSVVDAQYALKIYMKYLELKQMGLLKAEMRRIYDIVPNGGGISPMKSVSPANSMTDAKCI